MHVRTGVIDARDSKVSGAQETVTTNADECPPLHPGSKIIVPTYVPGRILYISGTQEDPQIVVTDQRQSEIVFSKFDDHYISTYLPFIKSLADQETIHSLPVRI